MILKIILFLLILNFSIIYSSQYAVTNDGNTVILNDDGTWEYKKDENNSNNLRPIESTKLIKGKRKNYGIWFNPKKWKLSKQENSSAEIFLESKDGTAIAMIRADSQKIPMNLLKKMALDNAKNDVKDAVVVTENKKLIGGNNILAMHIEGKVEKNKFVFYEYLYSGKIGFVQMIAYTTKQVFEQRKQDYIDLFNGFVLFKKVIVK